MHVLHLSESDGGGGAGKVAYALHDGLRARGDTSRMLVGRRLGDDRDVRKIKRNRGWRAADRIAGDIQRRLSLQDVFLPSSFGVRTDPWFRDADVLQFHNLHGSWFGYAALAALTRRVPGVWWIQDMWPLTGHAAFTYDCDRWKSGCGSCPYPLEYPRLRRDRSALNWRLKRSLYGRARLTLVVSSTRLQRTLTQSPLLSRFPSRVIPIGIDLELFAPRPKQEARARIGVRSDEPIVLCFDGEPRKGAGLLPRVLAEAAQRGARGTVLVAGRYAGWPPPPGFELIDLGLIRDERFLADTYAAADVFLFPTRDDFFPNAVLESIASGTPVVSTDVGGIPEQAPDGEIGLLCPVDAVDAFGASLARLLADSELRRRFSTAARQRALNEFSHAREIERFRDLYAEVTAR